MLVRDKLKQYFSYMHAYMTFENNDECYSTNKKFENIFCGLLNIIYNLNLKNMDQEKRNFPAIDLGDYNEKIGYQVTSETNTKKIIKTVKKFNDNELNNDFNSLKVLILGFKGKYKNTKIIYDGYEFIVKDNIVDYKGYIFNIKKNVIDYGDLISEIPDEKLHDCIDYLKNILGFDFNENLVSVSDKMWFDLFKKSFRKNVGVEIGFFANIDFANDKLNVQLVDGLSPMINEWKSFDRKFLSDDLEYYKQEILKFLMVIDNNLASQYLKMDYTTGAIYTDKYYVDENFYRWKDSINESQKNIQLSYNNMWNIIHKGSSVDYNKLEQNQVPDNIYCGNSKSGSVPYVIKPFRFIENTLTLKKKTIPFKFTK